MQLTRYNFQSSLPRLKEVVASSAAIAIDFEMTGIESPTFDSDQIAQQKKAKMEAMGIIQNASTNSGTHIQEVYRRCAQFARYYQPIQIGLCPLVLKKTKSKHSVEAFPYNVCLFPSKGELLQKNFGAKLSSIDFLAESNMDFNAWIHSGVFYLSKEARNEAALVEKYTQEQQKARLEQVQNMTQYAAFWEINFPKVQSFIEETKRIFVERSKSKKVSKKSADNSETSETDDENTRSMDISIEFLNPNVYAGFGEVLRQQYPELKLEFTYNSNYILMRNTMTISCSELPKETEDKSEASETEPNFDDVDFTEVISLISDLKKPLIFHSGFSDLLLFYTNFIGTLPTNVEDFSQELRANFGPIFDTKHIANHKDFMIDEEDSTTSGTNLETCFLKTLGFNQDQDIDVVLNKDFSRYSLDFDSSSAEQQFAHEAGFDSLQTGYVFAKFANRLGGFPELLKLQKRKTIPKRFGLKVLEEKGVLGKVFYDKETKECLEINPVLTGKGKKTTKKSSEKGPLFWCQILKTKEKPSNSIKDEQEECLKEVTKNFGELESYEFLPSADIELFFRPKSTRSRNSLLKKVESNNGFLLLEKNNSQMLVNCYDESEREICGEPIG